MYIICFSYNFSFKAEMWYVDEPCKVGPFDSAFILLRKYVFTKSGSQVDSGCFLTIEYWLSDKNNFFRYCSA